jgi:hypothetical protein
VFSAWDDDNATEPNWSDPEAWRGTVHPVEEEQWGPDLSTLWAPAPELPTTCEEELLLDEEDWCPGGWLEEWHMDDSGEDCG